MTSSLFNRNTLCILDCSFWIELRKELSSDERGNRSSRRKPSSDIEIDWNPTRVYRRAGGAVDNHCSTKLVTHQSDVLHSLRRAELKITTVTTGSLPWNRMNLQFTKQLFFFLCVTGYVQMKQATKSSTTEGALSLPKLAWQPIHKRLADPKK